MRLPCLKFYDVPQLWSNAAALPTIGVIPKTLRLPAEWSRTSWQSLRSGALLLHLPDCISDQFIYLNCTRADDTQQHLILSLKSLANILSLKSLANTCEGYVHMLTQSQPQC